MVKCLCQTVPLSLALKGLRRVVSEATAVLLQDFFLFFLSSFLFHTALADSFFYTESPDLWLDKDQMVNLGPERL